MSAPNIVSYVASGIGLFGWGFVVGVELRRDGEVSGTTMLWAAAAVTLFIVRIWL